jgi:hypothetical protein
MPELEHGTWDLSAWFHTQKISSQTGLYYWPNSFCPVYYATVRSHISFVDSYSPTDELKRNLILGESPVIRPQSRSFLDGMRSPSALSEARFLRRG